MLSPYNTQPNPRNVVDLAKRRPDQDIIESLRSSLEDAEKGLIVGLVIATHYGSSEFGYAGAGTLVNNPALGLGATFRLAQKLL
jgi:hypothetical protein